MKRVSQSLLLGAALLLIGGYLAWAEIPISIVGINASRVGDVVIVELHTTGPGEFTLDRQPSGNWLMLTSAKFNLDSSFGEIPLVLDKPDLSDLVTGASMVSEGGGSGVRLYLGPDADRSRVSIENKETGTTITIPAKSGPPPGLTETTNIEPATPVPDSSKPPKLLQQEVPVTDSAFDAGLVQRVDEIRFTPHTVIDDPTKPWPRSQAGFVPDEPVLIERHEPVEQEPVAFNEDIQLEDQLPLTPMHLGFREGAGGGFLPDAGSTAPKEIEPVSTRSIVGGASDGNLSDNAEVNYQFVPAESPDDNSDSDGTPTLDDEFNKMVGDLLDQAAGKFKGETEETKTATSPGPISSSGDTSFYGQVDAQAKISMLDNGTPKVLEGKEALSKLRIELFEIIDTPLDQALTLLVAPTDYNVIVDSSVGENTVSLSFKDYQTDLKSALDLITQIYGLQYVVKANTIVVASKEKMEGQLVDYQARLFVLSYADPTSVRDILVNTNLCAEEQVEVYAGESTFSEVNDSTRLSEATTDDQEIKPIETNLSSSPRNALLVKAVPEQMAEIAQVISDLDRKPTIIELEVRVCEAGESALMDLGIELNRNASTASPTSTMWTEQENENDIIEAFTAGSLHRSPLTFLATLNTQIIDGTTKVLAQPTLPTVEGKQAIFFSGERIPYISKVSQTSTGTQIEVDFLNVGITLNFKPRLDADGLLTIDVNPIVSSLLEFRIIADLVEAPRTSSRQTATTVRVADGEPFVLAGLISETERNSITKIPVLGDLPMLGKLFRTKDKKSDRSEIIIVVTPHIHK